MRAGKVVGSFREDNILEESLLVTTLGIMGILGSEPIASVFFISSYL